MAHWRCPAGDFETDDDEQKRKHMEDMKNDPKHKEEMEKMKGEEGMGAEM